MIDVIADAAGRDVSRETFAQLEQFADLLLSANETQNLISPASIDQLWVRHILDGAQLVGLASRAGQWCDIGSGPGLPGLVIAIITQSPIILVEPRRLRAEFLRDVVAQLNLARVTVAEDKIERVNGRYDIITARAVAALPKLFGMACHLAHAETEWLLPKGRTVKSELDEAKATWQGEFRLVRSRTSDESAIVIARNVRRRGKA